MYNHQQIVLGVRRGWNHPLCVVFVLDALVKQLAQGAGQHTGAIL